MPDAKPPITVDLAWDGDLRFTGTSGVTSLTLDGHSTAGPSPMQAVAFGLAGCMAVDVVHVLERGRHTLRGLRAQLAGERAAEEPRRFVRMTLHYTVQGDVPDAAVARAIQLSRDKYCSVWHSLRQDIEFIVTHTIEA